MKRNKKLLYIGIPLAVVFPLLLFSYMIGPSSVWFWAGVGLAILYFSWRVKREKSTNPDPKTETQ